jgi:hypothetical protein
MQFKIYVSFHINFGTTFLQIFTIMYKTRRHYFRKDVKIFFATFCVFCEVETVQRVLIFTRVSYFRRILSICLCPKSFIIFTRFVCYCYDLMSGGRMFVKELVLLQHFDMLSRSWHEIAVTLGWQITVIADYCWYGMNVTLQQMKADYSFHQ